MPDRDVRNPADGSASERYLAGMRPKAKNTVDKTGSGNRRLYSTLIVVAALGFFIIGPGGLMSEISGGQLAPDITTSTTDGREFHLHDAKGEIVLLDFWASWCQWCEKSVPQINQVNQQLADGYPPLRVMGVNVGEDLFTARSAASGLGMSYASWLDPDESISKQYGAQGLPLFVLLDTDRTVLWSQNGYSDDLAQKIAKVVADRRQR